MNRLLIAGAIAASILIALVVLILFSMRSAPAPELASLEPEAAERSLEVDSTAPQLEVAKVAPEPEAAPADEAADDSAPEEIDALPPLLRGRVLGSGQGIPGAEVRLWRTTEIDRLIDRLENLAGELAADFDIPRAIDALLREIHGFRDRSVKVTTDDEGAFELRARDIRAGSHILLTLAEGWLFRYGDVVVLDPSRTEEITIELERGSTIEGRVVGPRGGGVANVRVYAEYRPAGAAGIGTLVRRAIAYLNGEFLRGPFMTTTRADGAFTFSSLPPGTYDLVAEDPHGIESRSDMVTTGTDRALIVLGPGASVFGTLTDTDGVALGGIELLLESEAEVIDVPLPLAPHRELVQTINRYLGARHARTRSGPDGRFVFPHVGAGKQRISVSAPGLLPLLRSFEVEWSEAYDLGVLRLDRGKIVRGVVRAADGSPISEARVLAMQTDPGMFGFGSAMKDTLTGRITTASGPDGTFVLSGLGPHAYTVAAIAPGFGRGEKRVSRPEDTEEAWVEILLEPGVTIRGRVIDEVTGDPISGARVNAQEVRSETDAEGRFVLEGVPRARSPFGGRGPRRERSPEDEADETATSRSVRIEVARKGYVQVRERVSLDDLGREVEIELRRVPAIRGIVYDSAGDPAPGVLVRLSVDVPREMRDAGFFDTSLIFFAASITTLDGTFRFEDFRALPAEVPLCVIADSPGRPQARSDAFRLPETDEAPEVVVTLIEGARVEGQVTDGRAPVPGALVRLARARDRGPQEEMFLRMLGLPEGGTTVSTDAEGNYVFASVEAGDWEVSARKVGFVESATTPVSVGVGEVAQANLVVDPGGTIYGEIVDTQGIPIDGARASVFRTGSRPGEERFVARLFGASYAHAMSEADGRFAISGLPPDTYTLVVSKQGYAPLEVVDLPESRDAGRLVLVPAASLLVSVTDAMTGLPVTQYRIALVKEGERTERGPMAMFLAPRPHSDADGIWRRDDIEPGSHIVEVEATGYLPESRNLLLRPAEPQEIAIALRPAGRLVGRVVDAETGQPIANVEVALARQRASAGADGSEPTRGRGERWRSSLRDERDDSSSSSGGGANASETASSPPRFFRGSDLTERVRTDADGLFALESIPEGPQIVVVDDDAYVQAVIANVEVALGETREIVVRLDPGATVSGRVVGASGRAAGPRRLTISGTSPETQGFSRRGSVTDDGEFRFSGLVPGSYRIEVQASESASPVDVKIDEEGRDVSRLEIVIGE